MFWVWGNPLHHETVGGGVITLVAACVGSLLVASLAVLLNSEHLADPRRLLVKVFPRSRFAPWWRWVTLPGSFEEEDAVAYREECHWHLTSLHERLGDVFVQRRKDGDKVLFVRSPVAVRGVLLSPDFGKVWATDKAAAEARPSIAAYVHNLVQPLLDDPVFSKKGGKNSDARALLQPLFLPSTIKSLAAGFAAELEGALAAWPVGDEVDVLTLTHDALRGALYHAIAGDAATRLHGLCTPAFDRTLDYFVARYLAPGHDQRVSKEDERMMQALQDTAIEVAAAVRASRAGTSGGSGDEGDEGDEGDGSRTLPRGGLLAMLIDGGYSDAQAASVVINAVIAGAEAPASALAHTLRELAAQPSLQAELREEVRGVLSAGGDVASSLEEMGAVKRAVLEGLRLFAPATLVKRQSLKPTVVDGVAVPAGTVVEMCVTAIHLDAKQYDEPTTFEPNRLGPTAAMLLNKERAFMPFSGGARGCPGRPLALHLMRIALAIIVRRYDLQPAAHAIKASAGHAGHAGPAGGAPTAGAPPGACDSARVRKFILWPAAGIRVRLEHA